MIETHVDHLFSIVKNHNGAITISPKQSLSESFLLNITEDTLSYIEKNNHYVFSFLEKTLFLNDKELDSSYFFDFWTKIRSVSRLISEKKCDVYSDNHSKGDV